MRHHSGVRASFPALQSSQTEGLLSRERPGSTPQSPVVEFIPMAPVHHMPADSLHLTERKHDVKKGIAKGDRIAMRRDRT